MTQITCECGTIFESKRSDARYCSAKCRVAASRNKPAPGPVTDKPSDVTDKLPAAFARDKPAIRNSRDLELIAAHVHDFHPHVHTMMTDGPFKGMRKKCSGRWWCRNCGSWTSGKACHQDFR